MNRDINIATISVAYGEKMRYRYWITFGASMLLALVFLTSGVGKVLGQSAFLLEISAVVVSTSLVNLIAEWLPWVEIILGACLLIGICPQPAAGLSTALAGAFIWHNSLLISYGLGHKPCGCLGILDRVFGGELSTVGALYIDIGLIILALAIYFSYPGRFLDVRPWFLKRGRTPSGSSAESKGNNGTEDSDLLGT